MIVTLDRVALLAALTAVAGAVARKSTIPILDHLLLVAGKDGRLRVTATDMDLEASSTAAATVEAPGIAAVPSRLGELVRRAPDGCQLRLALGGDGQVAVTAGRARWHLGTLPAVDFPTFGLGDQFKASATPLELRADVLRDLLDRAAPATSTEETRYYLNGVYLHPADTPTGPVLRAVATDGHRLYRVDAPLAGPEDAMPGVIVPRQTVALLRKALAAAEPASPVRLDVSPTRIVATIGDVTIRSKLIDGTFPDYARVIPAAESTRTTVEIDGGLLAAALDRVSAVSAERTRAIKLTITGRDLTLSSTTPDGHAAEESLEIADCGTRAEVGFNARYLHDALATMTGTVARLAIIDAASPARLTTPDDDRVLMVLMPMRV